MSLTKKFVAVFAVAAVLLGVAALNVSAATYSCDFAAATGSNLYQGVRGAAVSDLQSFLKDQGTSIYPAGLVTGYFGPLTRAAVSAFQKAHSISPTAGYFGPLTKAVVRTMCGTTPTPSATPSTSPVTSGSPVPTGVASSVTVSLASNTPASTTVPANAALVPFTRVTFSAVGGDAVISSLTVQRVGLANDSDFASLSLLDQNGNQVGYSHTLGSTHQVTFNNALTIPSGQSVTYTLAGNISSTTSAGDVAALSLVSVSTLNGTAVSGSLPITGNSMTFANVTIGSASVTAGGLNPGASQQKIGTTSYILSSIKIQAGSTEDLKVNKIRWYQNGTAADGDVQNLKLMVAGVQVGATVTQATNKYVVFDLSSSPVTITKGAIKEFSLMGDIVSGSARTIEFDIYDNTDIAVQGATYGYNIIPSYPNSSQPYFSNAASQTTIGNGAFTVSKGVTGSTYVASGATSAIIGAFTFNVQGEPIQISHAVVNYNTTGTVSWGNFTNLGIYDQNGNLVAGPVDMSSSSSTIYTDTWTLPVGTNTYTVRGNIASTVPYGATIQAVFDASSFTARGASSNMTITSGTTGNVSGDIMTVRAGQLNASVSATPSSQTYIQGQTQAALANFVFDATGSGEDVRVSSIVVKDTANGSITGFNTIQNLTLYDGTTALSPVMQISNPSSAASSVNITFNLTSPIVVAKGTSKTIALMGDVISNSANTFAFGLAGNSSLSVTGATTAATITANVAASNGQAMTLAAQGAVSVATDATNPASKFIAAGSTGVEVGDMRIIATSENAQLNSANFVATITGSDYQDIAKAYLYDGTNMVASMTPTSTSMYFQLADNAFVVPQGSTGKVLTLKLDMANVGVGQPGTSGDNISISAANAGDFIFKGLASGQVAAAASGSAYAGATMYYTKTYPTVTPRLAVANPTLAAGTQELYKFSVSAPSYGDVALGEMTFVTSTSNAEVTNFNIYDGSGNPLFASPTTLAGQTTWSSSVATMNAHGFTGTGFSGSGFGVYVIPAGTTQTFSLKGSVVIVNTSIGASVNTFLQGDPSPLAGPSPLATIYGSNAFGWSDLAAGPATSTIATANTWFSGYRVAGLYQNDAGTVVSK